MGSRKIKQSRDGLPAFTARVCAVVQIGPQWFSSTQESADAYFLLGLQSLWLQVT